MIKMTATGRCLSNAASETMRRYLNNEPAILVQGTITGVRGTFKHAWVEVPGKEHDFVIDPTQGITVTKAGYYGLLKPKNIIRIKPEYLALLMKKGHEFYTKEDLKWAIAKDKELMAQYGRKKK